MVYYRDYYLFENWQYVETNYTDAITYSNYSDSSEDTLLETYSLETNWTDSGITDYHNPPMTDEYQNITQTVDFTAPLILMTQIYTLDNGEKIAWAELIHDMIIFNDTNNNGFYDVGLTSNGNSKLSLWSSDENIGEITPAAFQTNMVWNTDSGTNTMGQNYPSDISAEKISERIEFTPPSETSQDILSWGISYPNFTTMYSTGTPIQPPINATFDQMSPTDYSFGFEYALTDKDAELSYTQDVNKMQDSDFYSFCDGLSLSVPHYTYFISSAEIQKEYNDEMTKRQDLFQFTSNETEIAALDFADPVKMMYNLHNYSGSEEISTHESAGASVNLLATENYEQLVTPVTQGNIFANLIFGLENIVDTIPLFTKNDRLYTIATTNYPVWSGEKLVHDPVLRATYSEGGSEDPSGGDGPPTPPGAIPGVPILGLIFAVSLGTLIVLKRKHTTTI
jgi:hypothetical protein